MKKLILTISILSISILGFSQTVINTVTATATGDFYYQPRSGTLIAGSIIFTTSATFNGTNSTITIYVSDDVGVNMATKDWAPLNGTDEATSIVFNLSAGGGSKKYYELRLGSIQHAWYKFSYSAGNATVGTLKGVAFIQ